MKLNVFTKLTMKIITKIFQFIWKIGTNIFQKLKNIEIYKNIVLLI